MAKKRKPPNIKGEFRSIPTSLHPISHLRPPLGLACLHPDSTQWKAACQGRVYLLWEVGGPQYCCTLFASGKTLTGVCPPPPFFL